MLINLQLETMWGRIDTWCTGMGLRRPLQLSQGDIIPIQLERRDFRMEGQITKLFFLDSDSSNSDCKELSLKHSMDSMPRMLLNGWISIQKTVSDTNRREQLSVEAKFIRGMFRITPEEDRPLSLANWLSGSSIIMTPDEWHLEKTVHIRDEILIIKLAPNPRDLADQGESRQDQLQAVIVNSLEIYEAVLAQLQSGLACYGLSAERSFSTPALTYSISGDNETIGFDQGASVTSHRQDITWLPNHVSLQLSKAELTFKLTSGSSCETDQTPAFFHVCHAKDNKPKDQYGLDLKGKTLVLVGAGKTDSHPNNETGLGNFIHKSWIWSYTELQLQPPEIECEESLLTTWMRWPILPASILPQASQFYSPLLYFDCALLDLGNNDVSPSHCTITVPASSKLEITLKLGTDRDSDHELFVKADDFNLQVAIPNISVLPANSSLSNQSRLESTSCVLTDSSAAPPFLIPSEHAEPVSLIFRSFDDDELQMPSGLYLKPMPRDNNEEMAGLTSETQSFAVVGDLRAIIEMEKGDNIAFLLSQSVTGSNLSAVTKNSKTSSILWDPNQGQQLAELTNVVLKLETRHNAASSQASPTVLASYETDSSGDLPSTIYTLLPWVERHYLNPNDSSSHEDILYHRNLVCEFDEAQLARLDCGLVTSGTARFTTGELLLLARDYFARAGKIGSTIERAHWWPGLKITNINSLQLEQRLELSRRVLGVEGETDRAFLPEVKRGSKTLSIGSSKNIQWLDGYIKDPDFSCANDSFACSINVLTDGSINASDGPRLSTDLLVAQDNSQSLDHAGVHRQKVLKSSDGLLSVQQLKIFHLDDVKKSGQLHRLNGRLSLRNSPDCELTLHFDNTLCTYEVNANGVYRLTPVPNVDEPEALLERGHVLLSGPGIWGCPVELHQLISLELDSSCSWRSVCFAGSLTLVRSPLNDYGVTATLNTCLSFTPNALPLITDLENINSDIQITNPNTARFPHSALAASIRAMKGGLSVTALGLVFKPSEGVVDVLGNTASIQIPEMITTDGLLWQCSTVTQPSKDQSANPLWSWSSADATQNSLWQLVPFNASTLQQPSEDQVALSGMLWINDSREKLQFHRFLNPETPLVFGNFNSGESFISWDLLSSHLALLGAESGPSTLLAAWMKTADRYVLKVWRDGTELHFTNQLQFKNESDGSNPFIIQWLLPSAEFIGTFPLLLAFGVGKQLTILSLALSPNSSSQLITSDTSIEIASNLTLIKAFRITTNQQELIVDVLAAGEESAQIIRVCVQNDRDCKLSVQVLVEHLTSLAKANQTIIFPGYLAVRIADAGWVFVPKRLLLNATDKEWQTISPVSGTKDIQAICMFNQTYYGARAATDALSIVMRLGTFSDDQFETRLDLFNIPRLVQAGVSTPLGPWWQAGPELYGMYGIVEWDCHGLRAELPFDLQLLANSDSAFHVLQDTPKLRWRTTWGQTAWLHVLIHSAKYPGSAETHQTSSPPRLALARLVQEDQVAFVLPDLSVEPKLFSTSSPNWIWESGVLLVWRELEKEGENEVDEHKLGCVLIREGLRPWSSLGIEISPLKHPQNLDSVVHSFSVLWHHNNRWFSEERISVELPLQAGWSLQLHEQTLGYKNGCAGMLIHAGDWQCQLPVLLTRKLDTNELVIQPGVYRLTPCTQNPHEQFLDSSTSPDFCLHHGAKDGPITLDVYDLMPLSVSASPDSQWVELTTKDDQLNLICLRDVLRPQYLETNTGTSFPKQSIRNIQFSHRRIFGARLRVDPTYLAVVFPDSALLRHQFYTYCATQEDDNWKQTENPWSGYQIMEQLLGKEPDQRSDQWKIFADYWLKNSGSLNQIWNSGSEENPNPAWRDAKVENIEGSMQQGDCVVTWIPDRNAGNQDQLSPPKDPTPFAAGDGSWLGALVTHYENSIELLQESFWQWKRPCPVEDPPLDNEWRSENLLLIGRFPAAGKASDKAIPVLACLRSVSDYLPVNAAHHRGFNDDTARKWLLARGGQGFALRRVCRGVGPSSYQFFRSPFIHTELDAEIVASTNPASAESNPLSLPETVQQESPNPNLPDRTKNDMGPLPERLSCRFDPVSVEDTDPPRPSFIRPQRRVRLALTDDASDQTPIPPLPATETSRSLQTLIFREAVAYPHRIQNHFIESDLVSSANQLECLATSGSHSFFPGLLDVAYGTDKPGGMVAHTIIPQRYISTATTLSPARYQWARGCMTEYLMRDPQQYQLPMDAFLHIRSCSFDKSDSTVHLLAEDILGVVEPPADQRILTLQQGVGEPASLSFNPAAIKLLSRVGDQVFEIQPDASFIPCDESRQFFLIYSCRNTPAGSLYPWTFNLGGVDSGSSNLNYQCNLEGLSLVSSVDLDLIDQGEFVACQIMPSSSNATEVSLYWKILNISNEKMTIASFFNGSNFLAEGQEPKSVPLRIMPTLVTPKLAIVLQKSLSNDDFSNTQRIREATALFGSVAQSDTRIIVDSRAPEHSVRFSVCSCFDVRWQLRDRSWVDNGSDENPPKTAVILVKYYPDGQTLACSAMLTLPPQ